MGIVGVVRGVAPDLATVVGDKGDIVYYIWMVFEVVRQTNTIKPTNRVD